MHLSLHALTIGFMALGGALAAPGFLVELNADTSFDSFYERLAADNIASVPKVNISSPVFNGVSFQLTSKVPVEYNLPSDYFASLASVANFWPMDVSNKTIDNQAAAAPEKIKRGKINPIPVGVVWRLDGDAYNIFTPWTAIHNMTGVNNVHAKGITGSDTVIAIIDSGVDYTHDALGGDGFGPGHKVIGGYDFIGDDATYAGGFHPSADPMDHDGHGTAAAGIAAGKGFQYRGVAPDAKILAYRAFDSSGETYTTNDIIIAAMTRAYNDGADVISMSFGGPFPYKNNPLGLVASRISSQGVIMSVAAGNAGLQGAYLANFGGGGGSSISVGAVESEYTVTWPVLATSVDYKNKFKFAYLPTNGSNFVVTGQLGAVYLDIPACSLKPTGVKPNGTVVLIANRDTACTDQEQFANIQKLGYSYGFLVNGPSHSMLYNFNVKYNDKLLGGAFIDAKYAAPLKNILSKDKTLITTVVQANDPIPIQSTFVGAGYNDRITEWGPTDDSFLYPSISAPGGNVLAPNLLNNYGAVSGTSFAAPYLSGCAALYLSSRGISRSKGNNYPGVANDFRRALLSTGKTLEFYDGTQHVPGVQAPLIQQGAGIVDAVKLTQSKVTLLSDPVIHLNDTQFRSSVHAITIKNNGQSVLTYSASHTAGTTVTAISNGGANAFPPPLTTSSQATVYMLPSKWVLLPGRSATIYAYFSLPKRTASEGTVYAGKVTINVSNGESIGVPYMGVQQITSQLNPLADSAATIYRLNDDATDVIPQSTPIAPFNLKQGDFPFLNPILNYGTREFSIDLVKPNYNLATDFTPDPVKGSRNFAGFAGSQDDVAGPTVYPMYYIGRQEYGLQTPVMTFADGSEIPSGSYKVMVRALKAFSDRRKQSSWQIQLSDTFTIQN